MFELYRGDIRSGIYFFCTQRRPPSIPWIISVNNFHFSADISETMFPTNIYYTSLERSCYIAPSCVYCIKIYVDMAEKSQFKD